MPDQTLSAFPDEPVATTPPSRTTPSAAPAAGLSAFPIDNADRLATAHGNGVPPDTAATIFNLQLKTGLPADVIRRNLEDVQKATDVQDFDAPAFRKNSPLLSKWLDQHPLNASVAADDLLPLTKLEHGINLASNSVRALAGGLIGGLNLGAWGALQAAGDILGLPKVSAWAKAASDDAAAMQAGLRGEQAGAGPNEKAFYSGFESMGSSAPILLAGLAGMPEAAVLSLMGTQTGGQAYTQARAAGVSVPGALAFGTSQGAVEAATEMLPVHALFNDLAEGSGLLKTLAHQALLEVPGEQIATALQDLNEWATLRPGEPFSTYLAERPSAAVQTLIATLVATGAQTGAMHTLNKAIGGLTAGRVVEGLGAGVKESQLAARSPAKFQEFLADATKDTPLETLYAPIDTWTSFWQEKGIDPAQMAEEAGSSKEAYAQAVESGSDLPLPTAGYATAIAGTEHNAFWTNELRLAPGEMNARESEEFIAAHGDAVTRAATTPAEPGAIQAIHDQIVNHLVERGQMTHEDAQTNAALVSSMLEHFVERRAGLDAQTIFEARTDPRFVERVIGPEAIGKGQGTAGAGPGNEPLYQGDPHNLLNDPVALAALERRQTANPEPPVTGERRNPAVIAELEAETAGLAVGAGGAQQTLAALRRDPTLAARVEAFKKGATALDVLKMEPPTAEFLAHGPDGPLFNLVGGPQHGSTVGLASLEQQGIQVPVIPADTGERLNGDQLRQRMLAARIQPNPQTFYQSAPGENPVPAPMFFSRVLKAVEDSQLAKASGAQWSATIKNAKSGISQDEAMILGVPTLEPDKVYTKQQALDTLTQNALKVDVVELAGEGIDDDEVERAVDAAREQAVEDEVDSLRENYDEDAERDQVREQFSAPSSDTTLHEADPEDEDSVDYYTAEVDGEVITEYDRTDRTYKPQRFDTEREAQEAIDEHIRELEDQYVDENYSEPDFYDQARDYVNESFDEDQERQDIRDNMPGADEGVHYEQYTVGGPKDDYREIFLTLPELPLRSERIPQLDEHATISVGPGKPLYEGSLTTRYEVLANGNPIPLFPKALSDQEPNLTIDVRTGVPASQAIDYAVQAYHEERTKRYDREANPRPPHGWKDGHDAYDHIDNPIVRIRVSARETSLGKTLFIEEAQPPHEDQQRYMPDLVIKNWRELAMKYALRDAAQNGYAAVAWATGLQTAEHYSLNRVVNKITWGNLVALVPDAGTQWIEVDTKQHGKIRMLVDAAGVVTQATEDRLVGARIDKVIGEPAVAKMAETPEGGDLDPGNLPISISPGLMKIYEEDLRNVTNKLAVVKKTKGRVETVQMQVKGTAQKALIGANAALGITPRPAPGGGHAGWTLVLQDGTHWGHWDEEVHAQQALNQWNDQLVPIDPTYQSTQQAIKMTPELKAAVLAGQPLYQGEGEKRGATSFNPATGQALISLFAKADLTTFPHEVAHLFLELVGDTVDVLRGMDQAALSPSQRAVITEYDQTLLPFLGVANRESIGRDQHERFAGAWEEYLAKGVAPSPELRSVFGRMKAWFVGVYRGLRQTITLTPDVRAYMDRLLASDDAITAAQQDARIVPIFTDAASAKMTPEQFALYRKDIEAASLAAHERLDAQVAADVAKQQRAAYKTAKTQIHDQTQSELEQQPIYRALEAMREGTHPDGTAIAGETPEPLKLNRDLVVQLIGENATKTLPRPAVYTRDGGVAPQYVAEMFGFSSATAMLEEMGRTAPLDEAVDAETNRRMLLAHGGLLIDGTLHDKAREAVANELRDKVIRAEMAALQRLQRVVKPHVKLAEAAKQTEITALAGQVKTMQATARQGPATIAKGIPNQQTLVETARRQLADAAVRDIKPQLYWAAARKANDLAVAAAARQDFPAAIAAQTQQLLSLALYRESAKVLDDVDRRVTAARELDRAASRKRIGRAGATYQDQIDGILDRYEFALQSQKTLDRRAALRNWAAGLEGEGYEVNLTDEQLDDSRRVNFRELTYAELVGVTDSLRQIAHLANLKFRLLEKNDNRNFVEIRDQVVESLRTNNTSTPLPLEYRPTDEARLKLGLAFASHRKISMLARALDGHQDGGMMWEHVIRRINRAGDAELDRSKKEISEYSKILEAHYPGRALGQLHELLPVPEINGSLSHEARIAVGMNWGTQEGRDRLLNDPTRRWSPSQVQAILDTLDANDWSFIRETWKFNEHFWPEIAAQQERVTGIAPDRVTPIEVQTKAAGNFPGGYYHLAYDGRLSPRAQQNEAATMAKLGARAAYVRTTTRQGHVETRKSNVRLSVKLSLGVQFAHIDEVVHSLTHREMLQDVTRILRDSKVQRAIFETAGEPVYKQFTSMLEDLAVKNKPATNYLDAAANFMRTGTQIAGLGFNLWTGAQQPLGLFNGMSRVGPSYVMKGMGRWLRDASTMQSTTTWIADVSPMMRHRIDSATQDLADLRGSLRQPGGWFDNLVRTVTHDTVTRQTILDGYLWHIGLMQRVADVPTWLGAYEKAMANTENDEPRAIALADQAVLDSQGGGQIKDLASVQRGSGVAKLWLTFYSYGSTVLNSTVDVAGATNYKSPASVATLLGHLSLLYLMPALGTVAMAHAFGRAGGDDEDWRNWIDQIGREAISSALNGIVFVRELNGLFAQGTRGYEGPAGARFIQLVYDLGGQVKQGVADEGLWKAANSAAGVLFRYPSGQVQKTVDGFAALEEGRSTNPMVLLTGPPPKKAGQ